MTPMRRRLALGFLVALAGSAVAVWHGGAARAQLVGSGTGQVARQSGRQTTEIATGAAPIGSFSISGSVEGLYPGLTRPLTLTVTNPQHFTIVVTSLTVTVHDARLGCTAGNIAVSPFTGELPVRALGSATVTLRITLTHHAPNACQGAVFPLLYSASAFRP